MQNLPKHREVDAPLEAEKVSLTQELDLLKANIAENKRLAGDYVIAKQDVEQVKEVLGGLTTEIEKKARELEGLEVSIAEVKTAQQAVLTVIAEKQAEKDFLASDIKEKKEIAKKISEEIAILNTEKEDLEGVTEQKEVQQTLLEDLNKEIAVSMGGVNVLGEEIVGLTKTTEGLKADLQRVEQEIIDKEQGLAEREGGISIKETGNEKKEQRLKLLKSELEAYYKRKFPYIEV